LGKKRRAQIDKGSHRLVLIFGLVGVAALGVGFWQVYIAYNPPIEEIVERIKQETNLGKIQIAENLDLSALPNGEFGDRFTDKNAGFTVQKPNEKWHFITDVVKYRKEVQGLETTKALVGSVYVDRPNIARVIIGVQKGTESFDSFDMDHWLSRVVNESAEKLGIKLDIVDRYYSPEHDYGYVETIGTGFNVVRYDYETVRIYNDKLYLLHITSDLPHKVPQDVLDEIDFIFNSYKILP